MEARIRDIQDEPSQESSLLTTSENVHLTKQRRNYSSLAFLFYRNFIREWGLYMVTERLLPRFLIMYRFPKLQSFVNETFFQLILSLWTSAEDGLVT